MSEQKQLAFVTGASRGIGRAIAQELASTGVIVVGTATSTAGAAAISDYLSEFGGLGLQLDVTCQNSIDEALKQIESHFQKSPDILINNAAITADNLFMRMKAEEWDSVIKTNLDAVYALCRAVVKPMVKARSGRIINISSVVGFSGNPGQTNYCAAKAGLIGFTKSLAQELGSRGITVNAVAPGFIDTDMTKSLAEPQREALLQSIPLKRLGQPEDIAKAVRFLVSSDADYITGTTLHVNGGMYMS